MVKTRILIWIIVILALPIPARLPQVVAEPMIEPNLSLNASGSIDLCISPVRIWGPVYDGTMVVAYTNATAGCNITIVANGKDVGTGPVSASGFGEIFLDEKLILHEQVIGYQHGGGSSRITYSRTHTVEEIPASELLYGEQFNIPVVVPPVTECAAGFRAEGYVRGSRAGYSRSGSVGETGTKWTAYASTFLDVATLLREGDEIEIWQDMDAEFPLPSDLSSPVPVDPLPSQLPVPEFVEDVGGDGIVDIVDGIPIVNICGLHPGALVTIYDRDTNDWVGMGIATAECNWAGVEPLDGNQSYCVKQSLCQLESESDCVEPQNTLSLPQIHQPLCPREEQVIVTETVAGSLVSIFVNGINHGNATAAGHITLVPLDRPLEMDDEVAVSQMTAYLAAGPGGEVLVEDCSPEEKEPVIVPGPVPGVGGTGQGSGGGGSGGASGGGGSSGSLKCGATKIVCAGSVASGYVKVDDGWDPANCNPAPKYNTWTVKYYADCPIGTQMDVCGSAQIPAGWSVVGQKWIATTCNADIGAKNNIKTIRRDS